MKRPLVLLMFQDNNLGQYRRDSFKLYLNNLTLLLLIPFEKIYDFIILLISMIISEKWVIHSHFYKKITPELTGMI